MKALTEPIGRRYWAVAEGYIPAESHDPSPQLASHETICVLNTNNADADIEVMLFFADKDPVGPYHLHVPAQRTRHFRFNDLSDPQPVPVDTDFSSIIVSSVPVVVQHSRLDSRQSELALMTTLAYPGV